ncbi:MAG: MFS transporter [Puniceicoccaceae bacterium]
MTNAFPSFKRNYTLAAVEGSFFMGGIAFLSMESVMPAMVKDLGGPNWAIALAPVMMILGFSWPQVFSALWVERLRAMKPFILSFALIQRIPYLAAAILLFTIADGSTVAVMAVILAPFLTASIGGIIGAAYFELVARMIPVQRVASMWAIRNSIFAVFGIIAGFMIKWCLDRFPGMEGYAILHLMAWGMLMVSWIVFLGIREDNIPESTPTDPISLEIGFSAFMEQWRANRSLGRFVITRILFLLIFTAVPFLSLRAIEVTGSAFSLLGMLVIPQSFGAIAGNLIIGYLGDKFGVRLPMLLGRIFSIACLLVVMFATSTWHFMTVFFLLGIGINTAHVGDITMVIDFAPPKRRKFFFAMMGLLMLPGPLLAAVVCAGLRYLDTGFYLACITSIVAILISLLILHRVKDPRNHEVAKSPLDPQSTQTASQVL